jgi:serpin B
MPAPENAHEGTITDANNRFAFELYSHFRINPEHKEKNIFFSPYSMTSVLSMIYEGARGKTADEMASVFHFPGNTTILRMQYYNINAGIRQKDPAYRLDSANALWAQKDYPFRPAYLRTIREYYDADATNLDFISAPEDSRGIINRWIEEKTGGKITGILPRDSLNSFTRLVITNALYFRGSWVKSFDPDNTRDADFTLAPGKTVRIKMMADEDPNLTMHYFENNQLQIVEIPYIYETGDGISMLLILPKGNNLTEVETMLDAKTLAALQDSLKLERVKMYLPKFRIESQYEMKTVLEEMGMPTAFTEDADLSGMYGTHELLISGIFHKTFIDVDENGTEAAASTVGVVNLESAPWTPPPVYIFRADHSFFFIIQERETGTILFIGRVMNPNA